MSQPLPLTAGTRTTPQTPYRPQQLAIGLDSGLGPSRHSATGHRTRAPRVCATLIAPQEEGKVMEKDTKEFENCSANVQPMAPIPPISRTNNSAIHFVRSLESSTGAASHTSPRRNLQCVSSTLAKWKNVSFKICLILWVQSESHALLSYIVFALMSIWTCEKRQKKRFHAGIKHKRCFPSIKFHTKKQPTQALWASGTSPAPPLLSLLGALRLDS